MRERPILFSGPMVRALLDGRKTQTRRLVKPQPFDDSCAGQPMVGHRDLAGTFAPHVFGHCMAKLAPCPFGVIGDRLWVSETWRRLHGWPDKGTAGACFAYQADHPSFGNTSGWRLGVRMPRWASRLTLELTEIRVERLQEISEEDAKAEGYQSREAFLAHWANEKGNAWVWALTFKRVEASP